MGPGKEDGQATYMSNLSYVTGVASLVLAILCAWIAIYRQDPPDAQPANASLTEFASGRAMGHLKMIARKPHPVGSAEHAEVRNYILKELTRLGLNPEVQKSFALNPQRGGSYVAGDVQNLIGRIASAKSRQTILLACHYDSVPTSPGANDDGVGVAALLEVIRALKASPPLKNDILFLFTDGEECGLLGAKAFIDEHPYAKEVAVVLNFEARGISGPSIMFETSVQNEGLIEALAKTAPHPVANSLTYDLYKLLPNSTDLTVFKNGGLRGMNFAHIAGLSYYHTARDTYQNIDGRSLQHHGSYALALARHFGNMDDAPAGTSDAVYFDLFSSTLVTYSARWVLPLMALGLILYAGLVILGIRMKRLTVRGVAFGVLVFLLNAVCAGALALLIWQAVRRSSSNPVVGDYDSSHYVIGFLSLTIAITSALLVWLRKRTRIENLVMGALFWWMVLMALCCLRVPGGSYLFTWPVLLMLMALGGVFISRRELTSAAGLIILTWPALLGVILIAPLIHLIIAGFGMPIVWMLMAFAVFPIALHYAHLNRVMMARRWLLPIAAGLLGGGFIVAAILTTDFSYTRPKRDHIFYTLSPDTGTAFWGSFDQSPDEWTSQFLPAGVEKADQAEHLSWGRGTFLKANAPIIPLPPPSVVIVDDEREGGLRSLRMRVTSPRQPQGMAISWKRALDLEALEVNGKRVVKQTFDAASSASEYRRLFYFGPPEEGFELKLEIRSPDPVELKVEDWSAGISQISSGSYRDRPDYIIAAPFPYSDCTVVRKSVKF